MQRRALCVLLTTGVFVSAIAPAIADNRVSVSKKGSLLIYSDIELRWDSAGKLRQDTFLTLTNDYTESVRVQWYFINGDAPLDAVFAGDPPVPVERSHPGWNWVDHPMTLTHDESTYFAASSGLPMGAAPFTILDPGTPPGRPDTDRLTTERVLRGYAIAFAVDQNGNEISWNHLSGSATVVNYFHRSAWEYGAYAFQAVTAAQGQWTDAVSGQLLLDGAEYDYSFDKLLLDFYAFGSTAFSGGGVTVMLDTDLTLYTVDADLRQDSNGPVTTKAKFDIWNENEDGFSGTTRCITCWDQTLLSLWNAPNQFGIGILHTDKGKARIDGMQSTVCDTLEFQFPGDDEPTTIYSKNASLLGVANKILAFSGGTVSRTDAGETLVGQGTQYGRIQHDIIAPPGTLIDTTGGDVPIVPQTIGDLPTSDGSVSNLKDGSVTRPGNKR